MGSLTTDQFTARIKALESRRAPCLTAAEAKQVNDALAPWLKDVRALLEQWPHHTKPRFVAPRVEAGTCALWLIFSIFPRADHAGKCVERMESE